MRIPGFQRRRYVASMALSVLVAMTVLAGCGADDLEDMASGSDAEATATSIAAPEVATVAAAPVHWTYEGDEGPEHWGSLHTDYASCSEGQEQSPIDFASMSEHDLENITFNYAPSAVNIQNNGHTIVLSYDGGSSISVNGTQYDLQQFHFHSPSEHTSDGTGHEAELHLVHQSADKALAVVGVFIDAGAENTALAPAWEHLPAESGAVQPTDAMVNAADLLPADHTTFRYDGSLTTPPCSEDVTWLMMTEPISMSDEQLTAFTEIIEDNNRPVQPLNAREVQQDTTP